MRLREIFRFELAYQLRRATPWLCFAALFAFTFMVLGTSEPTDDTVARNSPFFTAFGTVLCGVIWLLIGSSVAGEAAARDIRTRMYPLIYAAPVSRAEYLGGRFLAAFVLNALIAHAVPAGMVLALLLFGDRLGPARPAVYLTTYGFVALPFVFVATAVQFAWATLQRRPMASYLGSVVLFITSHFAAMIVSKLLGRWELVRLLDVVGLASIVGFLGDSWTPAEQNTRLVGLEPMVLLNRTIWLAVAAGVLAFTWSRFRFAHAAERSRRGRAARPDDAHAPAPARAGIARSAAAAVPVVRQAFGLGVRARQALGIAGTSFRTIATSRATLVLVGLFALHLVVFMPEYMKFFDVPMFPTTTRVLGTVTAALTDGRTPLIVVPLLIAYYAGELVWRERDAGVAEITDAAPVPEWTLFLGKFLGLAFVIGAWLAVLAVSGIVAQLAMGYRGVEPGLYLQVLFGLQLPEYLLFACLALVVHAVADRKYLGHIVALLALGAIAFASMLGLRHNLLIYGGGPAWSYSEMRGFGSSLGPWAWFRVYWAAWALLLAVGATLLWARGRDGGLGARLRAARLRFTRRTAGVAAVAALLVLSLGGFVFYNTNVLNEYTTSADRADEAAEYERRYGRYEAVPQPRLAGVSLRVEIRPEDRTVTIRGRYRLVNRTAVAIDSIHVAAAPGVRTAGITFDRAATRLLADERLGHHIYRLERSLLPGDSIELGFDVAYEPHGFGNDGVDPSVVPNGTTFKNHDWLPAVGYQPDRELRDVHQRRARGLAGSASFPASLYDVKARDYMDGAELIDFDAVVGTDASQVAVAPGVLRRTWTEGGRRYFHYAADAPIRNDYALYSAAYALHEARWSDPAPGSARAVAIQVFHHPGHTANLARMVRSIQASLTRYTAEFGPYPYRYIRFIERAGGGAGMSADAGAVAWDEGYTDFNPDTAAGLDLPFYVVAHEVAHQWWGSQLGSAAVEGAWLMSESLAVYSGMQVLREFYGDDQVRRYLRLVRTMYEAPRSRAAVPLLRADGSFLGYRKGAVALHALSRYIGEDRVNGALRRTLEKHAGGEPPQPTSLDLYAELEAATPDSLRYLLSDLFEANTYWDLETEAVRMDSAAGGTWRVALDVKARKLTVDSAGAETEVPMDDWVEVGVFAAVGDGVNVLDDPIQVRMQRIRSGRQTITVTVPRKPLRAGIDPFHLLIDLKTDDNLGRVGGKESDGLI